MNQDHRRILRMVAETVAALALFTMGASAAQQPKPNTSPLPIKASLVLTPEFCATEITHNGHLFYGGHFKAGKAACTELEPALKVAFSSLAVTSTLPISVGDSAQLVIVPKFVDGAVVLESYPFGFRRVDVLLEWAIKDSSGKTLWLETVRGSATHDPWAKHEGVEADLSGREIFRTMVETSVKDAATQSAGKISAAPELLKFAHSH